MRKVNIGISFVLGLLLSSAFFHTFVSPAHADPSVLFEYQQKIEDGRPQRQFGEIFFHSRANGKGPRWKHQEEAVYAYASWWWYSSDGCIFNSHGTSVSIQKNGEGTVTVSGNTTDLCGDYNMYYYGTTSNLTGVDVDYRKRTAMVRSTNIDAEVTISYEFNPPHVSTKPFRVEMEISDANIRPGTSRSHSSWSYPNGMMYRYQNSSKWYECATVTGKIFSDAYSILNADASIVGVVGKYKYTERQVR